MIDKNPLITPTSAPYSDRDVIGSLKSDWIDDSCCCCNIAYFPLGKFHICGHWKRSVFFPTLVSLIFITSALVYYFDTSTVVPWGRTIQNRCIFYWVLGFSLVCTSVSYVLTIYIGPGYLPYNWSVSRKSVYTFEEMMSSMAIYQEQVDFGRTNERPPRASFSYDARRYVLRADHYCEWTKSWIGLKNHRFFLLVTFWASFYCIFYIASRFFWFKGIILDLLAHKTVNAMSIIGVVYCIFFIIIGPFSSYHFFISLINASKNITLIEKWNKRDPAFSKGGCCSNLSEICGSKLLFMFWPFPCFCLSPTEDGFYNCLYDEENQNSSYCGYISRNSKVL